MDTLRHIELITEMSLAFAASNDIEATLKAGLLRVANHLEAEASSLFLLEGGELVCRSCTGPVDILGLRLSSHHGIVGRTVIENRTCMVRDVRRDPDFKISVDDKTGFTTKSILCSPLSVAGQPLGAIEIINKKSVSGLFNHQDAKILEAMSAAAALAIANARMTKAMVDQERLKHELDLAAEIQRNLLPKEKSDDFPIHGLNIPARGVSGDFYDILPLDDGRIYFTLADVSGKGMNAALLTAKTSSLFRCLGKTILEPAVLLRTINAELCETACHGMFVTMIAGIYDPQSKKLRLANAGHEPPLFYKDHEITEWPADCPPLGIVPLLDIPEITLSLEDGVLYIFTDGLTEGYLESGEEMGTEGIITRIKKSERLSPKGKLRTLVKELQWPGVNLRDDITVMLVEGR